MFIYEHPEWPSFQWQEEKINLKLAAEKIKKETSKKKK